MKTGMKTRFGFLGCLVAAVALLALSGCGSTVNQATTINASYSTRPINVPTIVALENKSFEQEFAKDKITFQWHEIAAGPAQLEGLASKSLDITTSMNYVSALLAKANGLDIKVIAGYSQFPKAIAIVARTDSNINSIKDLEQRKVALQKGTMLQELLIKALNAENVSSSSVEMVSMDSTEAVNSIIGGQIEAAILPEPLLTKAISTGKVKVLKTAEGLISGQTFIVTRTDFAQQNPVSVKKFLKLHQESIDWAAANQEQFYTIAAKQLSLDPKAVKALYPKFVFQTALDDQVIANLKESAIFLQQNGFIKADVNTDQLVTDLIDTSYLK